MKRLLIIGLLLLAGALPAVAQSNPTDRIQRPCFTGAKRRAIVITNADGSIDIISCTGQPVNVNGLPLPTGGAIGGTGTAGTLAIFTAPQTLANSFATQSGNNFTVTGPAAGSIITLQNSTPDVSLLLNGTLGISRMTAPTIGEIRVGTAAGFQAVTAISVMGDILAGGNLSTVKVDDAGQIIRATLGVHDYLNLNDAAGTANIGKDNSDSQGLFNTSGLTSLGDPAGQGNATVFEINDPTQSYRFSKLVTCGFISTNGTGITACGSGTPATTLSATSGSIGGGALAAGACASTTATITGVASTDTITATPVTYPGDAAYWKAYMSAANTVTVKVCVAIAATPTASTYNLRVFH